MASLYLSGVAAVPLSAPASSGMEKPARATELPPAEAVSGAAASSGSNGDTASGDHADRGRDRFQQEAAALLRRGLPVPSRAAPSSVITAQAQQDPFEGLNPFEPLALPDPLPTAPILKHFSGSQG
ncbi:hypothetical protein ABMC89_16855 [Sulfitobacter sp. HNIBRBA3233]|uniref:hypothetical protein n=1 Tax=Sulfitobacter marinivivus TaxID=3158558 RepID=UPI0032DECCE2